MISCYLMFPTIGQTKHIKNEISLSNVPASSEQCVMVSEATHILDEGSYERFCVSSKSHNCRMPLRYLHRIAPYNGLGEHQPSAEHRLSRKAPQMPCPVFNPNAMAKRPGSCLARFPVYTTRPLYAWVCNFSLESKHCAPASSVLIMDL